MYDKVLLQKFRHVNAASQVKFSDTNLPLFFLFSVFSENPPHLFYGGRARARSGEHLHLRCCPAGRIASHLWGCHSMTVWSMLAEHRKSEWLQLRSTTSLLCPSNTRTGFQANTFTEHGQTDRQAGRQMGVRWLERAKLPPSLQRQLFYCTCSLMPKSGAVGSGRYSREYIF